VLPPKVSCVIVPAGYSTLAVSVVPAGLSNATLIAVRSSLAICAEREL
jgi:hypothetical protein